MLQQLKKYGLAAALAASVLASGTTAQARDRWDDSGNDAAIAIGAGIVGLAIGALIADRNDDRYYDRRYYNNRRYVSVDGYPGRYYYYNNNPHRYYRDRYYDRYYGRDYAPRYNNRWNRGYDRVERYYDRRDGRRDWRQDRRDWRQDRRDWRQDRRDWRRHR